jgi:hypothetical protein
MQAFLHLTTAEIGHGLIALVVLAAALPVAISVLILMVLVIRMVRARLGRIRQRRIAQAGRRVDAQAVNLASQRAG